MLPFRYGDRNDNEQAFKNESELEKYTKKMKKGVQDLANCIVEFECDPFGSTHTVVTTLHSGEVASVKLEKNLLPLIRSLKSLLPIFLKNEYFQGIKNLMRPCSEIGEGASQINQRQREVPIQCRTKLLKWNTRSLLRWSLLVQKRRCHLKK